jgi:flagellar basal-body rod protein FlgC
MEGIGKLFSGFRSAASGLAAERARVDVIARNVANAQTTSTPEGGPYRRQVVRFEPILARLADGRVETCGVRVAGVEADTTTPFQRVFDPTHPDADGQGFVSMPNVNAALEMADLITAMRAYEANAVIQETFVQMAERALRSAM